MSEFRKVLFYSPDEDGAGSEKPAEKPEGDQGEVLEWDTWHEALPEDAQELVAGHVSGLKTALKSERDARNTAEKDLRDVAGELEKGSEAQKKVLKLADDVAAGNVKTDFYEEAHEAGVSNLKLAFVVAKEDGLFDKRGNANFTKLKESYPELFTRKKVADGNAGEGTGSGPPKGKIDMNALIRAKAGR